MFLIYFIALESCKSELLLYESELANEHFLPGDLSKFLVSNDYNIANGCYI